jgi:dimethylargininase
VERLAFTREVGPAIHRCELTHLAPQAIDLGRARAQHDAYEACLHALGCTVRRLPPEPEHPDAVFVEDTAVVLDEVAVLARPGAASRRGEVASMAEALAPYRACVRIEPPGTLDGGDVLVLGRQAHVGLSSRTNADGIAQLKRLLEPHGYAVRTVFFTGCLHLKSAVTRVGEEMLLLNPAWVDREAFPTFRSLAIDSAEPFGANALLIDTAVVYPAEHPRTAERLASAGVEVRPVELSELAKAEGGVTCCCVLVSNLTE